MNVDQIENLDEIVDLGPNCSIIDQKIKRLTAPGENYGSVMLSVDITIETPLGTEEIQAVAKMVPPNELIQRLFNTQVSFKNEIAFYNKIVPTLQEFQKEQGIENVVDFFPKYYGSRISLNKDSEEVDSDAVLLLENLVPEGYRNLERTKGFDFETSKLILADLAHLHAVPIGLKLKKPDVFEADVKKYLHRLKPMSREEFDEKVLPKLDEIDELKFYKKRIRTALEKYSKEVIIREPFATICHNDCWANNAMLKVEKGRSVQNKLVDYQVLEYGNPAKDLLFFLLTSVRDDIFEKHLDTLIRFYHETFVKILEKLQCHTTRFSFPAFLREIDAEAVNQFVHAVFMTWPIFASKGSVKEISELTEEDFIPKDGPITGIHREKLVHIVRQCARKNWI